MTSLERSSLVDRFISRYSRLPTEIDPDYLEMLRMSKYRIVNVPDKQEAKCANCGSSKNDGRLYIDCNLDIDWYGTVFFCGLCMKELATAMGLFAELEEKISALESNRSLDEDLLEWEKKLNESVQRFGLQLREFHAAIHPLRLGHSTNSSSDLVASDSDSGFGASRDNRDSDKTKSRVTKSTSSTRRENVRSLAELLDDTDG